MRDPVCGTPIKDPRLQAQWLGCAYYFCSDACKQKFEENPGLYLSDSARGA